jgi:hypothetical protein
LAKRGIAKDDGLSRSGATPGDSSSDVAMMDELKEDGKCLYLPIEWITVR